MIRKPLSLPYGAKASALLIIAVVGATMTLGTQIAQAQERTNGVPVSRSAGDSLQAYLKLYDRQSDSWAKVDFPNPDLSLGALVAVCAKAKRSGYLSVWSRTLDGQRPVRIYPNDLTPEERKVKGGKMEAGQELCLGDAQQGYGFQVEEPLAPAEVYLHWSPDLGGQFAPEDIPVIPDHGSTSSRSASAPYSATVLRYRVVAANEGDLTDE